ncbi:uncharacterized protein (TIGR00375 family) [Methanomicrobium sp. W14]|uniref:endonuclease Q family protein n=1 Tax=Methanomicrobium sp. W14 TaxID=2817839 RepID=UPI001AE54274|nr:endonuclease Q family protein [Methanomicrobium sp. W14]MBP2132764.1 uncharacterized protein (TIGR00375 family) [Methanomicrobium sp. W14]
MILNADFHIHSPFSMAASKKTTPKSLLYSCSIKGIDILGSGDALHPVWRKMWENCTDIPESISIVPTAEVEGKSKVHHLVLMDDFSQAEEISEKLEPYSSNLKKAGRPNIAAGGEKIAEIVHDCGAYVGPAHAFTPWTGMYGRFKSLHECYGEQAPDFLELGLSADTSYGDRIPELNGIPFISNSDAHSPLLDKLGREFNRIDSKSKSPVDVINAVLSGSIVLNAGFFPEEGKYNRTACTRCYRHYSFDEAEKYGWRCTVDSGIIKEGVYDRSQFKSTGEKSLRPPYLHIMPLLDIIREVLGLSSVSAKKCKNLYFQLIEELGNEISVLTDVSIKDISGISPDVGMAIDKFREEKIVLHPGGGGMYGSFDL